MKIELFAQWKNLGRLLPKHLLFPAETGHGVECTLLPIASLPLQIVDCHLISESGEQLLGDQVVDHLCVYAILTLRTDLKQRDDWG